MAPGRKSLRKFQFGRETVNGTPVDATALWRGPAALLEDGREPEEIDEDVGVLGRTDRTVISALMGKIALPETTATFEQLQHLIANAFGGPVAGVADGPGSGRVYHTPIPTTTQPTDRAWSVEGGDDQEVEQATYAKVLKIALSGTSNKDVRVSAELMTREVTRRAAGFTGSVPLVATDSILFNLGRLYLDPVASAYGTTQVAKQWYGFKLTLEAMWEPIPTGDGALDYQQVAYTTHKITGEVTFLHDAQVIGASGEKANWRAQTPRRMQMRFDGPALTTAGTTYQTKALILNFPIKWKKFGTLGDQNETAVVTGTFFSKYNSVAGDAGNIIVVNELATLP